MVNGLGQWRADRSGVRRGQPPSGSASWPGGRSLGGLVAEDECDQDEWRKPQDVAVGEVVEAEHEEEHDAGGRGCDSRNVVTEPRSREQEGGRDRDADCECVQDGSDGKQPVRVL